MKRLVLFFCTLFAALPLMAATMVNSNYANTLWISHSGNSYTATSTGAIAVTNKSDIADLFAQGFVDISGYVYDPQFFVPLTGATLTPVINGVTNPIFVNPAGTIAALTITLPTGVKGASMTATFTQTVTSLTITGTNVDTKGLATPTAAASTSSFGWVWDSVSAKWNRVL
jgi:hypothetical protein